MKIIRIHAENYIGIGEALERIRTRAAANQEDEQRPVLEQVIIEDDLGWILAKLGALREHCEQLKLDHSPGLLAGMIGRLQADASKHRIGWDRLQSEVAIISDAISSEIRRRVLIFMPPERASWFFGDEQSEEYDEPEAQPFGAYVYSDFPSARDDIFQACRSFALGLDTACVFHLMRSLEFGLKAFAGWLKVPITGAEQWQNIIDLIEAKIRELQKNLPRGPHKLETLQFCGEAAKEFGYFKDAWRNYVVHTHAKYGMDESVRILAHVRDFMDSLARGGIKEPAPKRRP